MSAARRYWTELMNEISQQGFLRVVECSNCTTQKKDPLGLLGGMVLQNCRDACRRVHVENVGHAIRPIESSFIGDFSRSCIVVFRWLPYDESLIIDHFYSRLKPLLYFLG